jgi:hypothetical protein
MFRSNLSLRGIVVIAALMLGGGSAFGEAFTANDVMVGCHNITDANNNRNPYEQGRCAGLIAVSPTYLRVLSAHHPVLPRGKQSVSPCSTSTPGRRGCTKTLEN